MGENKDPFTRAAHAILCDDPDSSDFAYAADYLRKHFYPVVPCEACGDSAGAIEHTFCSQECARDYRAEFWEGLPGRATTWLIETLVDGFGMLLFAAITLVLVFVPLALVLGFLALVLGFVSELLEEVVRWLSDLLGL